MSENSSQTNLDLDAESLKYHRMAPAGKLQVTATKPLDNQRDLSLAYSPGVAAACRLIVDDPKAVSEVTSRGNLVAVVTNGTAVLGLGAIGPLASKPVMEGKAVLFKKFAGIDVFDLEIEALEVDHFCTVVKALEPTFGGINIEDIKAPECFDIENKLRAEMKIPVFHDDQHGTAIIVAAAVLNGLEVIKKDISKIKIACSGAGAAALACLGMLCALGVRRENITICDIDGVVYKGRLKNMDKYKSIYAQDTEARTLDDIIANSDVFIGLSAPGVLTGGMVKKMAPSPLIMALANPEPEIRPEIAIAARPDAICATGRSDYPNQVNNVLCFPYIFRGALDVGATTINEEMKVAAAHAIAALARMEPSEITARAYANKDLTFGPNMLIPKPFDPRLILEIAPAVALAAMETGVATRPIEDIEAYRHSLNRFIYRSGTLMKPLIAQAQSDLQRVCFAEGEDERVLRALQFILDDKIAKPIIIGRPDVIERRIKSLGLRYKLGRDVELVNPDKDKRFNAYWRTYHEKMGRRGVSPEYAKKITRTRNTIIGAVMLERKETDAFLCGLVGQYSRHLSHIKDVIGGAGDSDLLAALSFIITNKGTIAITDSYINPNPTAEEIAKITVMAAEEVKLLGVQPKIALLSHSNFGTSNHSSAMKMREATAILHRDHPELEIDGEMKADLAMDAFLRKLSLPDNKLEGAANLLVMPSLDAANISQNLLCAMADGLLIGPILIGTNQAAHILNNHTTVRGIVNMTTVAAINAQRFDAKARHL